jgi:hypothetical protein
MRRVALLALAAAVFVPTASAKGLLTVHVADTTPAVNEQFAVDVRTGWVVPENDWLRVVAVAPGNGWREVVSTLSGGSGPSVRVPRDGFEITLKRVAPKHWRALVRLPRAGRWRLVVPNGTHAGYMLPPPTAWMPWVVVHR